MSHCTVELKDYPVFKPVPQRTFVLFREAVRVVRAEIEQPHLSPAAMLSVSTTTATRRLGSDIHRCRSGRRFIIGIVIGIRTDLRTDSWDLTSCGV